MKAHLLISVFFCFCFIGQISAMRKQGVALRGKFLCGIEAASGNSTKVGKFYFFLINLFRFELSILTQVSFLKNIFKI